MKNTLMFYSILSQWPEDHIWNKFLFIMLCHTTLLSMNRQLILLWSTEEVSNVLNQNYGVSNTLILYNILWSITLRDDAKAINSKIPKKMKWFF